MGVLSAKSDGRGQNEDGELTFLGRVLAHLPIDLYLGKMVVLGHIFGCLNECLIIGQSVIVLLDWTLFTAYARVYSCRDMAWSTNLTWLHFLEMWLCAFNIFCGLFAQTTITPSLIISCLALSEEFFCHTVHAAACWPQVSHWFTDGQCRSLLCRTEAAQDIWDIIL